MNRSSRLNTLALCALTAYTAECSFGASGRWLSAGPLSIRMLLFIVCFFLTLPALLRSLKQVVARPYVAGVIVFGVYFACSACIGLRMGNSRSFVLADVTSLLSLALMPGFLAVIREERSLKTILKAIFFSAVFTACVTTILHLVLHFMPGHAVNRLNIWFNVHSMGGLALLSSGLQRVYLRSQIFLQVALLLGVHYILSEENRRVRLAYLLCEGLLVFACLISYTRGFWLGTAIGALLLVVFEPRYFLRYLKIVGASAVVVLALILISTVIYRSPLVLGEFTSRFSSELLVSSLDNGEEGPEYGDGKGTYGDGSYGGYYYDGKTWFGSEKEKTPEQLYTERRNMEAVNRRAETLRMIFERIRLHPVLGNGLGANLDGLREDGKTEYMYLDILMKMGILGLLLFLFVFFAPVIRWILFDLKRRRRGGLDRLRNCALICGYLSVAATSAVNPFLNNPMGIILLLATVAAVDIDCTHD